MVINRIMMKNYFDIKRCLKCIFIGKWTDYHNQANTGSPVIAQVVKNLPEMQETKETCVHFLSWENPLEEEMATHSNVLAWRIPVTEEPGKLQSIGLQRVRHDSAAFTCHWNIITVFPGGSQVKSLPSIQETRVRSLCQEDSLEEGGHGNLHKYSCPENPMDRGAWQATVHRVGPSQTQLTQLSSSNNKV